MTNESDKSDARNKNTNESSTSNKSIMRATADGNNLQA